MGKNVFLTGGSGFVGSALTRKLKKANYEVFQFTDKIECYADILNAVQRAPQIDYAIHLAGISAVSEADSKKELAFQINAMGTAFLAKALLKNNPQIHFIFASSAQVYAGVDNKNGQNLDELIIDEQSLIEPRNFYAETKWYSELILKDLSMRTGLKASILRLFNHTHKTQSKDFFLPYVFDELQKSPNNEVQISVGNIDLYRDLGSLDDLTNAFLLTLSKSDNLKKYDYFNICSGNTFNLRELADCLASKLGKSILFKQDPSRLRSTEAISIKGSYTKIYQTLDWCPSQKSTLEFINKFLGDL